MKKFISMIVILVLCISLTCRVSYAQDLAINDAKIEITGLCVSAEGFKDTFSGLFQQQNTTRF